MLPSAPEKTAFPQLSDEQMEQVASLGELRTFDSGVPLIQAGQKDYPFCVVKTGEVVIVDTSSGQRREVITHGPGQFVGDVDLLTGRPAVITAEARGRCEAYVVTACQVRHLLNDVPNLSDLLLDAFQMRRAMLEASEFLGVRVVGRSRSKATAALREFFYKNHVPHTFFDVEEADGIEQLRKLDASPDESPIVACGGHVVSQPSLSKIAECMGISRSVDDAVYDLIVVGAGPAGLAAAVYAASEGLPTLVVDRVGPGGQAGSSSKIENFIGFPSGLSGAELANRGYLQALKFGAHFTAPVSVQSVQTDSDGTHLLSLCTGQTVRARCVLVATGVSYRQLDLAGCREFEGAGVYYAATSVEARVCRQSTAVVIGGGNSAGQAAMYLAQHANEVCLLIRGDDLSKSMSAYLHNRIANHDKIRVLKNSEVTKVEGDDCLRSIRVHNNLTHEEQNISCSGLFIFIGAKPHTDWLPERVRLDERGFVLTGTALEADPFWELDRSPCELETTIPGIMAAGDVRSGTTKRCGFAVGDGSLAITCVHRHLNNQF